MNGTAVFAERGQIRRDLPVQKAEFLQFGAREGLESFAGSPIEQFFQPAPVRLAFFQPVSGDHECRPTTNYRSILRSKLPWSCPWRESAAGSSAWQSTL